VELPRGIYFVPPDIGASFPAKYEKSADWPITNYRTEAAGNAPATMVVKRPDGTGGYEDDTDFKPPASAGFKGYRTITINPQGLVVGGNNVLVVALGELQTGSTTSSRGVLFRDADSQRALLLSNYGIPTVINEKAGLSK
jgi:hypothetical protein